MFKRVVSFLLLGALFSVGLHSSDKLKKVEDFTLEDYDGVKHSLSDFKDSKAIVLMFIATQCPVSNAYNERMVSLYDDYKSKGVTVLGINSNKEESVNE